LIATLEREKPALLKDDQACFVDIPDQMWDGHGLLMAIILMFVLVIISVVAIIALNICEAKRPAATSAMLMIADPAMSASSTSGPTK
jgi:hypothetical protein